MAIQLTSASPAALGAAGMGGIETPRGRLGGRVFRACRGGVTRAARSISRLIGRLMHTRTRNVPLVAARAGGGPRASIGRLELGTFGAPGGAGAASSAPWSGAMGERRSPGDISTRSLPNPARGSGTSPPAGDSPVSYTYGVRLKPGRGGGIKGGNEATAGMPPPLPRRSRQLDALLNGMLTPRNAASRDVDPAPQALDRPPRKPVPTPRSRVPGMGGSMPSLSSGGGQRPDGAPTPPPRSRSVSHPQRTVEPRPSAIPAKGPEVPVPPARDESLERTAASGQGAMPVFHRRNADGPPITTRVGPETGSSGA
ncbi:hypothetical protein BOSP111201_25955 [Bordetella sputigena]|uniref:hypothetical protein n=1 Tax=Bordetella sputigena TaxID=1416810 RepID=UPI0039EE3B74